MKIAITGATGFIGSVLVPALAAAGHRLQLLSRRQQPPREGADFVYGSLLNGDALRQLVEGADVVIHLAATISVNDRPDPALFHTNTEGTRLLAGAARNAGVKRFIHLSSVTAYEQAPYDAPLDETRPYVQASAYSYDYSKAVSQAIALEHNGRGMEVIALAPTAVTGPCDQQPSLTGKAVQQIYKGAIPALFPGGVNFVDVRDVAQAIVNALTMGVPGQAYLLGGEWLSLADLCRHIGQIRGKPISRPVLPLWLVLGMLPLVRAYAAITGGPPYYTRQSVNNLIYSNRKINSSKAKTQLAFAPRPFAATLQDTIDWFRQTRQLI